MEDAEHNELIFIYNAESGLFNSVSDYLHKVMSPETYACSLCQITYGNLGMKKEWKDFLKSLPFKKTFLHKDELESIAMDAPKSLPAILLKREGKEVFELLSARELENLGKLKELMALISERIKHLVKDES